MSFWFGKPWPSADRRAPVCGDDARRIPTPVGASCVLCRELIDEDDRGEAIGSWDSDDGSAVAYGHIECMLRQVLGGPGHLIGRCSCLGHDEDPDLGMTARDAARWVWEWNQRGGQVLP